MKRDHRVNKILFPVPKRKPRNQFKNVWWYNTKKYIYCYTLFESTKTADQKKKKCIFRAPVVDISLFMCTNTYEILKNSIQRFMTTFYFVVTIFNTPIIAYDNFINPLKCQFKYFNLIFKVVQTSLKATLLPKYDPLEELLKL